MLKRKNLLLLVANSLSRAGQKLYPTCPTSHISPRTIKKKLVVLKLKKKKMFLKYTQTNRKRGTIISISFEPSTLHIHSWFYCDVSMMKYSRLSLSRSLRDSVKYFEISVPRNIRFAELRKKQPHFTNEHVI